MSVLLWLVLAVTCSGVFGQQPEREQFAFSVTAQLADLGGRTAPVNQQVVIRAAGFGKRDVLLDLGNL